MLFAPRLITHLQPEQFLFGFFIQLRAFQQDGGQLRLNWAALCEPKQTVVFYMGLTALDIICRELQAHGLPANHPAALVEEGTTARQRVVIGSLGDLPARVQKAGVSGTSLVIVGEVVRLHAQLRWFEGG